MESNSITYVCNAGVMLQIGNRKILIDGLCRSETPIFKNTPEMIREQIIKGIPPFDNIDVILVTHSHDDHFEASSISWVLENNPNTIVISNTEVISRIRVYVSVTEHNRLIQLDIEAGCTEKVRFNGMEVTAFSMRHDGEMYKHVNNLAYLIKCGMTVLSLGDAAPIKDNFESLNLKQYGIDILLANFPYAGLPSARRIVREYISPERVFILHLPDKEYDEFNWILSTKKSYDRTKESFLPTIFLEELGVTVML